MSSSARVKLGVFLLAGAALFMAMLAVFGGLRFWEVRDRYYVRVPDSVFGVDVGSDVHVRGVRVGRISRMDLFQEDFESVTLTLEVRPGTRINIGAEAHLRMRGVTGLRVVDVYDGNGEVGALEPGSHIPYARTIFDDLQEGAEDMMQRTMRLMSSSQEVIDRVGSLIAEVDPQQVDGIVANVLSTSARLDGASRQLESLIARSRQPVLRTLQSAGDAFAGVEQLTTELEAAAEGLEGMVGDLRGVVRVNAQDLRATMANLREASQSLRQMSRELRQRPSRLLFGGGVQERSP